MTYGTTPLDLDRQVARQIDKILRGAKPGDLPAEQPSRYEMAINLTTARALRIVIPQSLLLQADQLTESRRAGATDVLTGRRPMQLRVDNCQPLFQIGSQLLFCVRSPPIRSLNCPGRAVGREVGQSSLFRGSECAYEMISSSRRLGCHAVATNFKFMGVFPTSPSGNRTLPKPR